MLCQHFADGVDRLAEGSVRLLLRSLAPKNVRRLLATHLLARMHCQPGQKGSLFPVGDLDRMRVAHAGVEAAQEGQTQFLHGANPAECVM